MISHLLKLDPSFPLQRILKLSQCKPLRRDWIYENRVEKNHDAIPRMSQGSRLLQSGFCGSIKINRTENFFIWKAHQRLSNVALRCLEFQHIACLNMKRGGRLSAPVRIWNPSGCILLTYGAGLAAPIKNSQFCEPAPVGRVRPGRL